MFFTAFIHASFNPLLQILEWEIIFEIKFSRVSCHDEAPH